MLREAGRGRSAVARDVGRALSTFSRAARARHLYRANNAVIRRFMSDLRVAFEGLLGELGEISLKIRADSIIYDDEVVLEEPNPDESIPFAFYRDGVRRLDFSEGLEEKELEVLVSATAEGFAHTGLGDDIVSFLWRHELEHVRYMVVDTTIVDAASGAAPDGSTETYDLDAQIDGLLNSIYGRSTSDDVGPRSVRVDASDLSAKAIAETLDAVDEMAPGFHPARAIEPPAYAAQLARELEQEQEEAITIRAVDEGLNALYAGVPDDEANIISESMLRIYDSALVSNSYRIAARIVRGMRELTASEAARDRADAWIGEAVQETRLRQVTALLQGATENEEVAASIYALFEACGPRAVPTILMLISGVPDPAHRRGLSDVAVRIGIDDLVPLDAMLSNDQAFVAIEAIYMLQKIGTPKAADLLAVAYAHPLAPVRAALLQSLELLPKPKQVAVAVKLLDDTETEVKVLASRLLANLRDVQSLRAIEGKVKDAAFLSAPYAIKEAFLSAYVSLAQVKGLPLLAKMFQDGGGILAKKDAEELAIAAARALGTLGTPGAVTALKKAATFLNMRVRDAANEALKRAKARSA